MEISKTALFRNVDDSVSEIYARHKLGDVDITKSLGKNLADLIAAKLPLSNYPYAIYTTNKYPINAFCKKNSLLLSEIVATQLSLPLFVGEYSYKYNLGNFYDDHQQRHDKIHLPFLKNKKDIKSKNYRIIMIDDTTVTGLGFQASMPELEQVTDSVDFFILLDLERQSEKEKVLNEKSFRPPIAAEIINQKGYVFTTQMVRSIEKLTPEVRETLLSQLSLSLQALYLKARTVYFDEIILE